ncbi:MAG: hypothetical protein WBF45_09165 [Acidobacteriaceae bacterium]
MLIFGIHPLTVITAEDYQGLLAAWKRYGGPLSLVGEFVVKKALTDAQYRRLPQGLKDRLKEGDEIDAVSFLERLYRLPDPRTSSE